MSSALKWLLGATLVLALAALFGRSVLFSQELDRHHIEGEPAEQRVLADVPNCLPGYGSWSASCIVHDGRTSLESQSAETSGGKHLRGTMTLIVRQDVLESSCSDDDTTRRRERITAQIERAWRKDSRRNRANPSCVLAEEKTTEPSPYVGHPAHAHLYLFVCQSAE